MTCPLAHWKHWLQKSKDDKDMTSDFQFMFLLKIWIIYMHALLSSFTDLISIMIQDVMSCSLTEMYWYFWGTYCLHLQGQGISKV
jgi:hypothetical protein